MKIIYFILKAQEMSDLAKAKREDKYFFYKKKEEYIKKALSELRKQRHSNVSYKIEKGPDQNGYPSNIYYFEFKVKGKLYQFSFHQPRGDKKPQGNSKIKWDRHIGGCQQAYRELVK